MTSKNSELVRLDKALVDLGLCRSRTLAAKLVRQGEVKVNHSKVIKPSTLIQITDQVEVLESRHLYVSRAAHKLLGALELFPRVGVQGRRCLDAGASTGGFTQVLLERGAAQIAAVDVGHDQLVHEIRSRPEVQVFEGMNIREVGAGDIGGPVELVVADLSFISLTLVVGPLAKMCRPSSDLLLMVKPQFEVGREHLPKTGVVTSSELRCRAVYQVLEAATQNKLLPQGLARSPLEGQDGNAEFFLWLKKGESSESLQTHSEQDLQDWLLGQHVKFS